MYVILSNFFSSLLPCSLEYSSRLLLVNRANIFPFQFICSLLAYFSMLLLLIFFVISFRLAFILINTQQYKLFASNVFSCTLLYKQPPPLLPPKHNIIERHREREKYQSLFTQSRIYTRTHRFYIITYTEK